MSRKQRRDHDPWPMFSTEPNLCGECGEKLLLVRASGYDRTKPVSERLVDRSYWRHRRRWQKKPHDEL